MAEDDINAYGDAHFCYERQDDRGNGVVFAWSGDYEDPIYAVWDEGNPLEIKVGPESFEDCETIPEHLQRYQQACDGFLYVYLHEGGKGAEPGSVIVTEIPGR